MNAKQFRKIKEGDMLLLTESFSTKNFTWHKDATAEVLYIRKSGEELILKNTTDYEDGKPSVRTVGVQRLLQSFETMKS